MCDASVGNYLYKKNGNIGCQNNNKIYVLRLPTTANFRMIPLKGLKQPAVTISFFVKIYGFAVAIAQSSMSAVTELTVYSSFELIRVSLTS